MKNTALKITSCLVSVFLIIAFVSCSHRSETSDVLPEDVNAEIYDERSITLIMVGDVLMHKFVQQSGLQNDGHYNFDHIFSNISDEAKSADIAIVNQETLLAGEKFGLSGYPCFNAPLEVADAIAKAGFNVVLQATNHALDKGVDGLLRCRDYWKEKYPGVVLAGTAESEAEAAQIPVIEKNGIRVAILNYTYSTNGIPLPDDKPWAVNLLEENKVKSDLTYAKEISDIVVVCPHWGTEYSHTPSEEQKKWCDIFYNCGADLVIGTHPHVIQPVNWVQKGDGHRMLVYYSLGNFVNSTAVSGNGVCNRMLGGMAKIKITVGSDGETYIEKAEIIPLITQLNRGFAGVTTYPFYKYTPSLADANTLVRRRDPLFSYDYCVGVFKDVFGDFGT